MTIGTHPDFAPCPPADVARAGQELVDRVAARNCRHRVRRASLAWPGLTLLNPRIALWCLRPGRTASSHSLRLSRAAPCATDLVAHRGWVAGHRRRARDLPVARYHRHCAGPVHRPRGLWAHAFSKIIGAIQLRHEDRQRMAADPGRRPVRDFRHLPSGHAGRRRTWPDLGDRRLFNRLRRIAGRLLVAS